MKKILSSFLIACSLLSACSLESNDPPSESTTSFSEDVPKSSITSYSDETLSCDYDSDLLETLVQNSDSNHSYTFIAYKLGDDPSQVILEGSYTYVYTLSLDAEMIDFMNKFPEDATQALFDGVFNSNADISTISDTPNGFLYKLQQDGYTARAMIIDSSSSSITIKVYKAYENESVDFQNALYNCFNSIKLSPTQNFSTEDTLEVDSELCNLVTSICPTAILRENDLSSLDISITLPSENPAKDSEHFFYLMDQIIHNCSIEDYYSDVTFTFFVDKTLVTMIYLNNYIAPDSFISTFPLLIEDGYEQEISSLYAQYFSSFDASSQFDDFLNEIS